MQILMPREAVPRLAPRVAEIVPGSSVLSLAEDGSVDGRITHDEVILLRWWGLSLTGFRRVVTSTPGIRWIHTISVGVDHVLFPELAESDILLTNARGIADIPMAEMILARMLFVAKRFPEFSEQQANHQWRRLKLQELCGRTVGIVGLGSVGKEFARLARACGMRILATKRYPEEGGKAADVVFPPSRLYNLLRESDFVVLTVALTPETRHLIDADALSAMNSDAWLVNVSRGPVVDEAALLEALQKHELAGACLDVFETEPLPRDSPLWDISNVIITPHNALITVRLYDRSADLFLENLRRYVAGKPLLNLVDKATGY